MRKHLGRFHFNFAVTVSIICILATLLLHSLVQMQSGVDKIIHDTELNNLRLSLAESWVHRQASFQTVDSKALANTNPMRLISEPPNNYIGEKTTPPANQDKIWYFDIIKKELVYVYSGGKEARYVLVSTIQNAEVSYLSMGGLDLIPVPNQ
ncbi:MAG: hypothetical protein CVU29_09215 [Betaproteobacteria bacterium HGW-Betaproteobacteria-22]|nr:MAG: hypothetical protein CVU29_09215 [Betaproteobacteria bacterium HGW-Betaproteobacteria-22]